MNRLHQWGGARQVSILARVFLVGMLMALPGISSSAGFIADSGTGAPLSTRSKSGQFVVYRPTFPTGLPRQSPANLVQLDPSMLAISCERVKAGLLRQLNATDQWKGKIHVELRPSRVADDSIAIEATHFLDGWSFRLATPEWVEPAQLTRALVNVLLLEMTNRDSRDSLVELPAWLTVGMVQHLTATSPNDLVLPAPRESANTLLVTRTVRDVRRTDTLEALRQQLQATVPLTFEELSWPSAGGNTPDIWEDTYQASAQAFVHELLQLKNGPACMRGMIERLPRCLNWQTAFLAGFGEHFHSLLAVEKWWALQVVHFTGRNLAQAWPNAESWRKLSDLVRSPVQVRVHSDQLPMRATVSLQTVIQEWDRHRQTRELKTKTAQLKALRMRVSQDVLPLTDQYLQTLEKYLDRQDKLGISRTFSDKTRIEHQRLIASTLKKLDALDVQLNDLGAKLLDEKSP